MPRPKNAVPVPRKHKGRSVLDVNSGGTRRTITLGAWGSEEANREYKRFLIEFGAGNFSRPSGPDATLNEIMLAHLLHAAEHYRRPDGSQTPEVEEYKALSRLVRPLYGAAPAREFGPLSLKAIRQLMVENDLCRSIINQRIGRLRRVFKWAASEELIPFEVYHRLTTVAGLQRGRSKVRDAEPVEPVADERVDATLPFLNRHVRGLIAFQRLTGCRPGEACRIRRADIDTGGAVWVYRPVQHKNAWRGKRREIAIGPKAQEALREFFTPNLDDFLFSPKRAMAEWWAERRKQRKTSVPPSQQYRRKAKPKRSPGERYNSRSLIKAVSDACDKAFPPPAPLAQNREETRAEWWERLTTDERAEVKRWRKENHWAPNRLRHAHATKVRKTFTLEHAGAALGHSKMSATQIYAERDAGLALEVAAKLG